MIQSSARASGTPFGQLAPLNPSRRLAAKTCDFRCAQEPDERAAPRAQRGILSRKFQFGSAVGDVRLQQPPRAGGGIVDRITSPRSTAAVLVEHRDADDDAPAVAPLVNSFGDNDCHHGAPAGYLANHLHGWYEFAMKRDELLGFLRAQPWAVA